MRCTLELVLQVKYSVPNDACDDVDKIVVLTKDCDFSDHFKPAMGMEINLSYGFGFTIDHIVYFPQTNAYLLRRDQLNVNNREKSFYDSIIEKYINVGFREGHIDLTKQLSENR